VSKISSQFKVFFYGKKLLANPSLTYLKTSLKGLGITLVQFSIYYEYRCSDVTLDTTTKLNGPIKTKQGNVDKKLINSLG